MTTTATPPRGATLVTGGTGAVGSAVARRLLAAGHDLTFTYHSNQKAADELVGHAESLGRRAVGVRADLADANSARDLVATAAPDGELGTLVHAAGPFVAQKFISSVMPDEYLAQLHRESAAFFTVVHAALPSLRAAQGSVTAVTTVALRRFPLRDGLSPTTKAGIEALVRVIAAEEGRFGVRANCVGPGLLKEGIAADLIDAGQFDEKSQDMALRQIPLRRFGLADEVAAAAVFLSSRDASYITGQFIDVDGGYAL